MTVKEVTQIVLKDKVAKSKKSKLFKLGINLRNNKVYESNNLIYACTDSGEYIGVKI